MVQLDKDLQVQPAIAKGWDISDDAKAYTFHLRTDVLFHQHELLSEQERLVKTQDFVYSFNRLTDSKIASPGAWVMNNVQSYEALNDSTLRIIIKTAFPPFLGLLSMPYCSVVPEEVVSQTSFRDEPVGTGLSISVLERQCEIGAT